MTMQAKSSALAFGLLLSATGALADEPKVDRKPLSIAALHEFGQLGKGIFKVGTSGKAETLENEWMDHFGAFLTQEATVNERLFLSAGLGGVFQYRKPERVLGDFYGTQRAEFFIGPTKAEAVYHLGEPAQPWLKVGTGMFGFKYNPTAYNLGEYLFRSLPYPTVVHTGGYVLVGSAGANLQGFKANLDLGAFKADLLLTTETGLAPLFDWSLGALASYTVGEGLLELGGGVNFKRLIQVNPSRTAREVASNGYFQYQGKDYSTFGEYYDKHIAFYNNKKTAADSAIAAKYKADKDIVDSVALWTALRKAGQAAPTPPEINYYTAAGTLLMGRATFDPKKLLDSDAFGPEDLKLYGEVALLGWTDYPVFYKKKSERMPIMFGFNIPTFKVLDLLALQVEQLKSPWLNNTSQVGKLGINLPHFPLDNDPQLSEKAYNDLATHDDFKWSLVGRRRIGGHITLSGQVASDHLKLVSSNYFYGPQFDHNEVTTDSRWDKIKSGPFSFLSKPRHWYWAFQVGWGL